MLELYKKMYATLVGRVDTAISNLANVILLENCDRDRLLQIAKDLQQALQDVEEMYLEAEDLDE